MAFSRFSRTIFSVLFDIRYDIIPLGDLLE
jgi:hypothetical protein